MFEVTSDIGFKLTPAAKRLTIRTHLQAVGTTARPDERLRLPGAEGDRSDAHEVRRNLRQEAASLDRAHSPKARRPGWSPHDVARWHDAARRNATRSGESPLIFPMVQELESMKGVANPKM